MSSEPTKAPTYPQVQPQKGSAEQLWNQLSELRILALLDYDQSILAQMETTLDTLIHMHLPNRVLFDKDGSHSIPSVNEVYEQLLIEKKDIIEEEIKERHLNHQLDKETAETEAHSIIKFEAIDAIEMKLKEMLEAENIIFPRTPIRVAVVWKGDDKKDV